MIFIRIYGITESFKIIKEGIKEILSTEFQIDEDLVKIAFPGDGTGYIDMKDYVFICVSGLPSNVGVAQDLFKQEIRTFFKFIKKKVDFSFDYGRSILAEIKEGESLLDLPLGELELVGIDTRLRHVLLTHFPTLRELKEEFPEIKKLKKKYRKIGRKSINKIEKLLEGIK